jgi:type II secretory pathway component PulF
MDPIGLIFIGLIVLLIVIAVVAPQVQRRLERRR